MCEQDVRFTWEEFKDFILWANCTEEGMAAMAEGKRRSKEATKFVNDSFKESPLLLAPAPKYTDYLKS